MNNKELELLFGAICFVVAIILGVREYRIWNTLQNDDWILKSLSFKKIGGIVGLCIIGLLTFYRYFS